MYNLLYSFRLLCMENILIEIKEKLPAINIDVVKNAFEFIANFQSKKSIRKKRNYQQHVISILKYLVPFYPDQDTVLTAILHELMEDSYSTFDSIKNKFGMNVAKLVSIIESLRSLNTKTHEEQYENYKKLLLAISKDLRVILLRLIDRLDIMEHIDEQSESVQKKIALDTMLIYVPIAAHLGVYSIKVKLEDIAFHVLQKKEYEMIEQELNAYTKNNIEFMCYVEDQVKMILKRYKISAEVYGRIKHKYSIYKKLSDKGQSNLDSIFDVFALRIILNNSQDQLMLIGKCYEILAIMHQHLTPIHPKFKDYIANPKFNGYRSLHTTVYGLGMQDTKKPVEIQIRTKQMHDEAELGFAAHSLYKGKISDSEDPSNVKWIKSLISLQKELAFRTNVSSDFKYDIFSELVFVISDDGQICDLPAGSRALDFAYYLGEDIGHRCTQIKVNGLKVPFDYILQNGDNVKVLLSQNAQPNLHWISTVKSTVAKNHIKDFFEKFEEENLFNLGKNIINKKLNKFGLSLDNDLTLLANYGNRFLNFKERSNVVELVGKGDITVNQLVEKISPDLFNNHNSVRNSLDIKQYKKSSDNNKILVTDVENLPITFAACCSFNEGDPIQGYVGRGASIKIHSKYCSELNNVDTKRFIDVSWHNFPRQLYVFTIKIKNDRIGVIADISTILSKKGYNILHFNYDHEKCSIALSLKLQNQNSAEQVSSLLHELSDVLSISYAMLKHSQV